MSGTARSVFVTVLLALSLGGGGGDAVAQERGRRATSAGYLAAGFSAVGTGELDDRLAAHGYPRFDRPAAAVGLGGYLILAGGAMLGGEWNGLLLGEESHEGREVGLEGGYGTLGIGYAVDLSPRARLYPRLGIGGGGVGLRLDRGGEVVGFDEVLSDPDRQSALADSARAAVLTRGSLVLDVGGGAELLPGGWGRGLLIGVRLGYLAAPSPASWRLHERAVSGGPALSLAGPYLRVMIGGEPR